MTLSGAEVFVKCLEQLDVEYIFTVPGAAIDPILNVLADHGPKVILCRHEQNAGFMAECWGNIKQKPGVCLVTAGPGLTNIVTPMATAWSERYPLVAFTGTISDRLIFKKAHQNIRSVELFEPITKWSVEANCLETLPEIISNGFQIAVSPKPGPVHISVRSNILSEKTEAGPIQFTRPPLLGAAPEFLLDEAASLIASAKQPLVFLGSSASMPSYSKEICNFIRRFELPVVGTFQAAGAISRDLEHLFLGRLGVFKNQPGDRVVDEADLLIMIGFDPVEYDPAIWNKNLNRPIIDIDLTPPLLDQSYHPQTSLIGDISLNLAALSLKLKPKATLPLSNSIKKAKEDFTEQLLAGKNISGSPIHPLRIIYEVRKFLSDDVTVVTDVGSHQYWWARHFLCFKPKYFLTSMGFQTMGVALPWAIGASLARPNEKVFSISGDGSFMMSSMELETAVRLNLPIVHMVWEDGTYNLVKIQQELKYGRSFASTFGGIDMVKYAESFGCQAFRIEHSDQIKDVLTKAFQATKPVVISVPIDNRENSQIIEILKKGELPPDFES